MFTFAPTLDLKFNEPPIPFGDFQDSNGREISENMKVIWKAINGHYLHFTVSC